MAETFFIGDTHFGHLKLALVRGFASVEEHDEELVKRWNAVVRKRDAVWHLGDVLFGTRSFPIIGRLNGTKKLVAGNHDQYPTRKYLEAGFNKVVGSAQVKHYLLTHIAVSNCQFERWPANIHGHTHRRTLLDGRYWCVSAEQNDLYPISLCELEKRHNNANT